MPDDKTSLWVSDELWSELNSRKERGDSFEDVIWRLIEENEDED